MKTPSRRHVPDQHREHARSMRVNSTKAENMLWQAIRNKQLEGFRFKRQVPIEGYIVDFVCFEVRLVIEADGSQHAESDYDKVRDEALKAAGFRMLRFWNDEIVRNIDGACRQIVMELVNTGE